MSWNYIDNSRQLLRRRPFMISPVSPLILTTSTFGGWDVKLLIETRDRRGRESNRMKRNEVFLITSIAKKFICVYTWASGVGAFWLEFSSFSLNLLGRTAHHRTHYPQSAPRVQRTFRTSNRHFSCSRNEEVKATPSQLFSYSFFSPLPYTFSVCQIDKLSCEFRRLADCISHQLRFLWGGSCLILFWRCRAMSVLRDWFLLVLASNFLHNFFLILFMFGWANNSTHSSNTV